MTDYGTLYALACHALGDFPLQTGHMAREKLDDATVRAKHVSVYTASMVPFALATDWGATQRCVFLVTIWGSHFVIDSGRWNDEVPIWFDQALHIIALAVSVALTEVVEE